MFHILETAWLKFRRDHAAGTGRRILFRRAARYAQELASARFHLADVNEVGDGVRTLDRPRIENHGFISIGEHSVLRSINVPIELATERGARLLIGPDCFLNYGISIGCTHSIRIGARCRLGPYVMLIDSEFHDLLDRAKRPQAAPVEIGDDVWIGAKASVLPGVTIGRGAVVGTSAVVTKNVAPFTVVAGVPAKVVKHLDPAKFIGSRLGEGEMG